MISGLGKFMSGMNSGFIIFESDNFIVEAPEHPLVDRNDGGHITINPTFRVSARQELTPRQAVELMRLSIVAGEAMTEVLIARGVDIGIALIRAEIERLLAKEKFLDKHWRL